VTARKPRPEALTAAPESEPEILAAIAAQVPYAEILAGPWGPEEAQLVLRRHGLAASPGGSIVRVDLDADELLALAERGEDPVTARKAARARALLTDLRAQLAKTAAGEAVWDVRRRRRAAVEAWIEWLRRELNVACAEHIRLQDPAPARRPPVPPTTRVRPANLPDAVPDEEPCAIPASE
jgi:hypothetical protein